MPIFQKAPVTPEEIAASAPLDIPPEEVLSFDEQEWYARAYRGETAPQLTLRAVLVGSVLGFLLAFTNVYVGLKTGWHLGVALTACILSFTLWNGLQRIGLAKSPMSILESNCMQSTASAAGYATGNTTATAIPAMLLLSISAAHPGGEHIAWPVLLLWIFFLAMLGVFLAIPMKRNMINQERLKFPTGTAAAVLLQSLYSQGREAMLRGRVLLASAGVAALVPLVKDLELVKKVNDKGKTVYSGLVPSFSNIFDWLPTIHAADKNLKWSELTMKLDNSLLLIGAGALVGLRVTASMVVGGLILAHWVAPHALEWKWMNPQGVLVAAASKPGSAWKEIGIWVGAPMMVTSGLLGFALRWRTIARAFTGFGTGKNPGGDADIVTKTEVPLSWFAIGAAVAGVGIVVIAWRFFEIPLHYGVMAVLMTFILALVACRATGETDITPSGAMGKIMQLTYGVLIPQSTTANLMTAGITSGAALASADLLSDLKSGYLLGANPRRQFLTQFFGVFTGTIASTLAFFILLPTAAPMLGVDGADPQFPAPGAQQWKAVAELFKVGIQNFHPMAQRAIVIGMIIGTVLALAEIGLPKYKKWLPSPTGLALGFILPFYSPLAMFIGAVLAEIVTRADKKTADRYIIPMASGVIAGESILGVLVAGLNNFLLH
ncbi:MAG: Oligopeptide transporter, family [Myxococcaceae bacterium]|nr:Oligopeptide transporter, family [Myxococcaceae bacterium]